MKSVDLVIPVYDGLEETRACLESVLQTVDRGWVRPIVINDCSPNPEVTAYLRQLGQAETDIELLENDQNRGFVFTANRGMNHSSTADVLLLNSDVEVAGNWLANMQSAAYADDQIGSVTPFSNNATIFSFPNICSDNELLYGLSAAELAEYFEGLFQPDQLVDVPTAMGFCMYIRRDCLNQIGGFNEALFGRGYGEENDWSQRALAAGWRNVQTPAVFTYHKGSVSFGDEQKPAVARAMDILDKYYPSYHSDIQAFIAEDPARSFRVAALLAVFAATNRPKIAFISHNLGGGVQQHVEELAGHFSDQALFLQMTPESDGQSIRLAVFDAGNRLQDGLYFNVEQDYELLVELLRQLGIGRLHFHHTMGLNPRFWGIAMDLNCPHDLTVHDYYLVNGNPTLTDQGANYVDESLPEFDALCAGHYPLPPGVDAAHWRDSQRSLVEGADRVIFPSVDCSARFRKFFRIEQPCIARHPDFPDSATQAPVRWVYEGGRPLRVLVLGAISREKGADILDSVASSMAVEKVEFHLLGYAYRPLHAKVIAHGPYDNDQVDELVAGIDPDCVWLPARWPETYSYTLSIALRLGLPVVVPDIGAFAERIAGRAHSIVQPWNRSVADWREFWSEVSREQRLPDCAMSEVSVSDLGDGFYDRDYLIPVPPHRGEIEKSLLDRLENHHSLGVPALSRPERFLAWLWRLSRSAWAARILSLVPFRLQRAIKRRFSSRPMHDIVREQ